MKQTVAIVALFVLVAQLPNLMALAQGDIEYDPEQSGPVTLYATKWCGYCAKTRALFKKHNIPYTEHDIEDSSAAAQQMMAMGAYGVPVVIIGDTVIRGYQPSALLAALDSQ
ncbi:MAG: glutaredoxin family protein [Gammaproteobacteria bacterium]|nr:glutaredoxin family protein [Gammaproteobacteria bacterium]